MKPLFALVLILSVGSMAASGPAVSQAYAPMTSAQLAGIVGAGFGGGTICGLAVAAAVVAGAGILAAATAGTSLPFSICLGFSIAAHIDAVCLMLD